MFRVEAASVILSRALDSGQRRGQGSYLTPPQGGCPRRFDCLRCPLECSIAGRNSYGVSIPRRTGCGCAAGEDASPRRLCCDGYINPGWPGSVPIRRADAEGLDRGPRRSGDRQRSVPARSAVVSDLDPYGQGDSEQNAGDEIVCGLGARQPGLRGSGSNTAIAGNCPPEIASHVLRPLHPRSESVGEGL